MILRDAYIVIWIAVKELKCNIFHESYDKPFRKVNLPMTYETEWWIEIAWVAWMHYKWFGFKINLLMTHAIYTA